MLAHGNRRRAAGRRGPTRLGSFVASVALALLTLGCSGAPKVTKPPTTAPSANAKGVARLSGAAARAYAQAQAAAAAGQWANAASGFHAAAKHLAATPRARAQPPGRAGRGPGTPRGSSSGHPKAALARRKTCNALLARRDDSAGRYAEQLLDQLAAGLRAGKASVAFATAAGMQRASWVPRAKQRRAKALMARAGAALWAELKRGLTPANQLTRLQAAAGWALQLPADDPSVRAWQAASRDLARRHEALRAARAALPFAAWVQERLAVQLGAPRSPQRRRWLLAVVRGSSLDLRVKLTGDRACAYIGQQVARALRNPLGQAVPVSLELQGCGPGARHGQPSARRVLLATVRVGDVDTPIRLGTQATATDAELDARLAATAAQRVRAAARPVRAARAAKVIERARTRQDPVVAEDAWLHALAWAGTLPADGQQTLQSQLGLTAAQLKAALSTKQSRPRLLLRLPPRPYLGDLRCGRAWSFGPLT